MASIESTPSYVEERGGKFLLIWPDKPSWMVVDREAYELIEGKRWMEDEELTRGLIQAGVLMRKPTKEGKNKIGTVTLNITDRCNLRCIMCYTTVRKRSRRELTTPEFIDFLEQTSRFTSDKAFLLILGGEPLMVPEKTLKVSDRALDLGLKPTISTNGTLVTDEFAERAKALDLDVQVSIDGASPKTNDAIRGKGSFEKAWQGVKRLKDHGVYVTLCMVMQRSNEEELERYYELANSEGVNEVRFIPLQRVGRGKDMVDAVVDPLSMVRRAYRLLLEHEEYRKMSKRDFFTLLGNRCLACAKMRYCGTGMFTILCNANGDIYPCTNHGIPEFMAGNVREKSVSEMWNGPVFERLRSLYDVDRLNPCSKCTVRYWCSGGCRGEAYSVSGRFDSPSPDCGSTKRAILEMFWIIAEHPELVSLSPLKTLDLI
jgi:radical SAM protein with 4Fe4S-binding SPASM domain